MLSIIICSIDPERLSHIKINIAETVGIPYEILAIENSINPRGITAVYNEGAKRAKFDYLCYVHEDVVFESNAWGQKCVDILQDPEIGLVGIAGSGYKSLAPSGWHCDELESPLKFFQRLIQSFKYQDRKDIYVENNPLNESLSEVVIIDGVWFCTRKEVVKNYPFDEELLKHFHGYDVDFSLSVRQKYKIMVTYEILIKHLSEGIFDKKWFDTMLILHTKWNGQLPAYLPQISEEMIFKTEKLAFKKLIDQMIARGYSKKVILQVILNSYASPKMGLKLFSKIYFYYLKKTF